MAATGRRQAGTARGSAGRPAGEPVYIHGNTVRKPEPVQDPERHAREAGGQPQRREQPRVSPGTLRRNREKALQVDLPYLVLLVIASCCALSICISYLHLQSEMNTRMDNIKQLEQELEVLRSDNDAMETEINTRVDLDHVYQVATQDLGMVYAGKDQVLLYNRTESEYVRQNEDIPRQ